LIEDRHGRFDSFLWLGRGSAVLISFLNRDFLLSLGAEIENLEFLALASQAMNGLAELTAETAVSRFAALSRLDLSIDFSAEVGFVASHFGEISNSEFSGLSFSILSGILSSGDLKIRSENDLYFLV
jgi:hypothetical protein